MSLDPLDILVAELVPAAAPPTTEEVLTSPEWFGLSSATPLQRAICRIADGLPIDDLLALPLVDRLDEFDEDIRERCTWEWCIGDVSALPSEPPAEIDVVAGIRGGKSLFAAVQLVHAAITADLSGLRHEGEAPRFPIVGTSKDIGAAIYGYVTGAAKTSPRIASMLVGEPTKEQIAFRHPSGRLIEGRIAAGSRAGSTLVARWLVGAAFDEAPRMLPAEEGVINLDEQLRAIAGRMRPGATILCIGSPWAPLGPVHQHVIDHWQRPTADLVVIRAPGPALNPSWWTPERCRDLRRKNLDAYRRDVLAEFGDLEASAFLDSELRSVTREELTIPPEPGVTYYAEMDPATRTNAWALVVGGRRRNGKRSIVYAREWRSEDGAPLSPARVLAEVRDELAVYGLRSVGTDQHMADALIDIARPMGLHLYDESVTAASKANDLDSARALIRDGSVELPPHPLLQGDLRRVRRRLTPDGGVRVVYPVTADGRHCDFAGPVMKLLARAPWTAPRDVSETLPPGWTREECEQVEALERRLRRERDEFVPGFSDGPGFEEAV